MKDEQLRQQIKTAIENSNSTQEQIAKMSGVARSTLCGWLNGSPHAALSRDRINNVCEVLGVEIVEQTHLKIKGEKE